MKKIGFIGAGVMGGALISAASKSVLPEEVLIYDAVPEKTEMLSEKTGCSVAKTGAEVVRESEIIMICVHPHMVNSVLEELLPVYKRRYEKGERPLTCSIAAGYTLDDLTEVFAKNGMEFPLARLMPNIPLRIEKGVLLFAGNDIVSDEEIARLMDILKKGGLCKFVSEHTLMVAVPIFSCSPAYVYMFIEALADAGSEIGLERGISIELAAMACYGSAAMVLETDKHVAQLRDELSTPGGMTITSTNVMEQSNFRGALIKGALEAYKRSLDMI